MSGAATSAAHSPTACSPAANGQSTWSDDSDSPTSIAAEKDKKASAEARAVMEFGDGYRRILDAIGQPGYPSMRALFYGDGGPPAGTVPAMTVSFELFEAVQTRFANTKLALERSKADLHVRHQQFAVLQSQHDQLQEAYNLLEKRAAELEKKNTQLHQSIAKQDVTSEQLRQQVKHFKEEMVMVEEKMAKRDLELEISQNRVAAGLVALSQKETIIANLRRQMGRGGRLGDRGSISSGLHYGENDDSIQDAEYSEEALQRIASHVEGRSVEAQLRLLIVELEARIKSVEDEKQYVMLRHTFYRKHVQATVEVYEMHCMSREDDIASHRCEVVAVGNEDTEEASVTLRESQLLSVPTPRPPSNTAANASPMPSAPSDPLRLDAALTTTSRPESPSTLTTSPRYADKRGTGSTPSQSQSYVAETDPVESGESRRQGGDTSRSGESTRSKNPSFSEKGDSVPRTSFRKSVDRRRSQQAQKQSSSNRSSIRRDTEKPQSAFGRESSSLNTPAGSRQRTPESNLLQGSLIGRPPDEQSDPVDTPLDLVLPANMNERTRVESVSFSSVEGPNQRQTPFASVTNTYPASGRTMNNNSSLQGGHAVTTTPTPKGNQPSGSSYGNVSQSISASNRQGSSNGTPLGNLLPTFFSARDGRESVTDTQKYDGTADGYEKVSTAHPVKSAKEPEIRLTSSLNRRIRTLARNYASLHETLLKVDDFVRQNESQTSESSRRVNFSAGDESDPVIQMGDMAEVAVSDALLLERLLRFLQRRSTLGSSMTFPKWRGLGSGQDKPTDNLHFTPESTLSPTKRRKSHSSKFSPARGDLNVSSSTKRSATGQLNFSRGKVPNNASTSRLSPDSINYGVKGETSAQSMRSGKEIGPDGNVYPGTTGINRLGGDNNDSTKSEGSMQQGELSGQQVHFGDSGGSVAQWNHKPRQSMSGESASGTSFKGIEGSADPLSATVSTRGPSLLATQNVSTDGLANQTSSVESLATTNNPIEDANANPNRGNEESSETIMHDVPTAAKGQSARGSTFSSSRGNIASRGGPSKGRRVAGSRLPAIEKRTPSPPWRRQGQPGLAQSEQDLQKKGGENEGFEQEQTQGAQSKVQHGNARADASTAFPQLSHKSTMSASRRHGGPGYRRPPYNRTPWVPSTIQLNQQFPFGEGVAQGSSDSSRPWISSAQRPFALSGASAGPPISPPLGPSATPHLYINAVWGTRQMAHPPLNAQTHSSLVLGGTSVLPISPARQRAISLSPSRNPYYPQRLQTEGHEMSSPVPPPPRNAPFVLNRFTATEPLAVSGHCVQDTHQNFEVKPPTSARTEGARALNTPTLPHWSNEQILSRILHQCALQNSRKRSLLSRYRLSRPNSSYSNRTWPSDRLQLHWESASTRSMLQFMHARGLSRRFRPKWIMLRSRNPQNFTGVEAPSEDLRVGRLRGANFPARVARRLNWARRTQSRSTSVKRWLPPKPRRSIPVQFEFKPIPIQGLGGWHPPKTTRGEME